MCCRYVRNAQNATDENPRRISLPVGGALLTVSMRRGFLLLCTGSAQLLASCIPTSVRPFIALGFGPTTLCAVLQRATCVRAGGGCRRQDLGYSGVTLLLGAS